MRLPSKLTKIYQTKTLLAIVGSLAAIVVFGMIVRPNSGSKPVSEEKTKVMDFSKELDAQGFAWNLSKKLDAQTSDIASIKKDLEENHAMQEALENIASSVGQDSMALQEKVMELEDLVNQLQTSISNQNMPNNAVNQNMSGSASESNNFTWGGNPAVYNQINDARPSMVVHTVELQPREKSSIKNIKDTIPSNSFINASLSNGVDVSASDSSQQNPKPVLLTITGWGNLPNDHKLKTLKQCRVHAMAWGDMSSERVFLEPDLMTCVSSSGDIVETSIKGYVVGEDGAAGMRGRMVTRDQALVNTAVIAGTLSGLGDAFAAGQGTQSISPLGVTETYSTKDIAKVGLGKGVGTGLDMLAKYKIKQAENLHPIIQINGGRQVDIVFYYSATLGDVNQKLAQKSNSTGNKNNMQMSAEVLNAISAFGQMAGEE